VDFSSEKRGKSGKGEKGNRVSGLATLSRFSRLSSLSRIPPLLTAHCLPLTLVFPCFLVTSYLINDLLRVEKESHEEKAHNG